jgi:hypothetical protein
VLVRGTAGILDRRLAIVGVMFLLLIVTSTLVFDRYLGVSLLDALYFVVVTVATRLGAHQAVARPSRRGRRIIGGDARQSSAGVGAGARGDDD